MIFIQSLMTANKSTQWTEYRDSFESMDLPKDILTSVYRIGFKKPTDIQASAIPAIHTGESVIAQAPSGTGKTAAYGLGMLSRIDQNSKTTQAIVLVHTRELAVQVHKDLKDLSASTKIIIDLFHGESGEKISAIKQRALRLPHVAVCTPGIALNLIKSGSLRMENVKILVLDEADELFGKGFVLSIAELYSYFVCDDPQFLIFSATFPNHIMNTIYDIPCNFLTILKHEEEINIPAIGQYVVEISDEVYKFDTLLDIYSNLHVQKSIIFCNRMNTVDELARKFNQDGFRTLSIHSSMNQSKRNSIMKEFRDKDAKILISTDLTSRGIDVRKVTLVVNYDMPIQKETYIHRIGRCGRNEMRGFVINLITRRDFQLVNDICNTYNINMPELPATYNEILDEIIIYNNEA